MPIDIDSLTEAELIDLNNRIVERLRFMHQARSHKRMLDFKIGDRVSFQPEGRGMIVGILTRYNKRPSRSSPKRESGGTSRRRSCARWSKVAALAMVPRTSCPFASPEISPPDSFPDPAFAGVRLDYCRGARMASRRAGMSAWRVRRG